MEKEAALKYYKDMMEEQKGINAMGYYFNEEGKLRSLSGKGGKFKFSDQEEYNELGRQICQFVQLVLEKLYHMKKQNGITTNDYIYISESFFGSTGPCLLLIQGSGMVRPGYALK